MTDHQKVSPEVTVPLANRDQDRDPAFSARVRELISDSAHGIGALARKVGVAERTLRKWAAGESDPSREHLVALARAAGVNLSWLAIGHGPKQVDTGASTAISENSFPFGVQEPRAVSQWHDEKDIDARVKQAQDETAHLMHLCYQALDEHLEEQGKRMPPDKKADAVMVLLAIARREIERAAAAGDARTAPTPSPVIPRDLLRRLVKLAA